MLSFLPKKHPATPHPTYLRGWAVATGLLCLLCGCADSSTSETTSTADTVETAPPPAPPQPAAAAPPDSTQTTQPDTTKTSPTATLGPFMPRKLPNGLALTIPANGTETRLLDLLQAPRPDSVAGVSAPIIPPPPLAIDRLTFAPGLAVLQPESREQLQNLAAILNAYPAVWLMVGTHTTDAPTAPANKKLAQQRTQTLLTELTRLGVAANRLQPQGLTPTAPANAPPGSYLFVTKR